MFITNLLVAGSIAYIGLKSLPIGKQRWWQRGKQSDMAWSSGSSTTAAFESSAAEDPITEDPNACSEPTRAQFTDQRHRAVASTAFWLAVGGYFFPPLTLVSVPFTILSTVPILEAGGRSLFKDGKLRPSVFNSALIVTCLVTERYVPAATLSWLHHTFRHMRQQIQDGIQQATSEINEDLVNLSAQALGNPPRNVWAVRENIEVQTPYTQLEIGDIIVVSRGEFVPVDGVVKAGSGTINMVLRTGINMPLEVSEGERVYARSFVSEGRIRIQVEKLIQQ